MVGTTSSGSLRPPEGQRVVMVPSRVWNRTPSARCMWWSPNSDSFQPPKEWNAIGTGIGTLMPTSRPRCHGQGGTPRRRRG